MTNQNETLQTEELTMNETPVKKNYLEELAEKTLALYIRDPEFFKNYGSILKEKHFTPFNEIFYPILFEIRKEYDGVLSSDVLKLEAKKRIENLYSRVKDPDEKQDTIIFNYEACCSVIDRLFSVEADISYVTGKVEELIKEVDTAVLLRKVLDNKNNRGEYLLSSHIKELREIAEFTISPAATWEEGIITIEDFAQLDLPKRQTIIHPWLKENSTTLISGWRGAGKSWFLITLLDAITRGLMFGPWETITPVPCLYTDGELNEDELQERFDSLRQVGERKAPLYIYNECLMSKLGLPKANLLDPTWRKKILEYIIAQGIKVNALDNLSALAGGVTPWDENTKKDWTPIGNWLIEVKHHGCATLLAHHTGKGGDQRGSSAREDTLDNSILLLKPNDYRPEQGCRFILKFTKKRTKQSEAHLIQDYDFQLKEENGKVDWEVSGHKSNTDLEILKMISDGAKQADIGKAFKISQSAISQKKRQFLTRGWLDKEDELTTLGKDVLSSSEWISKEVDV